MNINEAVKTTSGMYGTVTVLHENLLNACRPVAACCKSGNESPGNLADIGFEFHRMEKHFDEMRKIAKAHKTMAIKLMTLALLNDPETMNSDGADIKAVGELCSAVPDLKDAAILPKQGTPESDRLLAHLGVDLGTRTKGLVKPDFKAIANYVTKRKEEGLPLPPGVTKTFPEYSARFYPKRRREG